MPKAKTTKTTPTKADFVRHSPRDIVAKGNAEHVKGDANYLHNGARADDKSSKIKKTKWAAKRATVPKRGAAVPMVSIPARSFAEGTRYALTAKIRLWRATEIPGGKHAGVIRGISA